VGVEKAQAEVPITSLGLWSGLLVLTATGMGNILQQGVLQAEWGLLEEYPMLMMVSLRAVLENTRGVAAIRDKILTGAQSAGAAHTRVCIACVLEPSKSQLIMQRYLRNWMSRGWALRSGPMMSH
jgi:hypothetical protein